MDGTKNQKAVITVFISTKHKYPTLHHSDLSQIDEHPDSLLIFSPEEERLFESDLYMSIEAQKEVRVSVKLTAGVEPKRPKMK